MKKLFFILITVSYFHLLNFAQNFEGVVVMDMTSQGMSITQEYKIKGDRAVAEVKVGGIPVQKMYVDGAKKDIYMLRETDKKVAVRIKVNDTSKDDDKNKVKVTETKETKDILGYKCTKIIIEDNKKTTIAWVTKEVNIDFDKLFGSRKEKDAPTFSKYGFPIEIESKDENKAITMKVTKIEKNSISDSIFPDLSQYEIQDMPSMGLGK
ncbi:MAG: DUF4412 domain-containing protein [Bacteroidia bacterium]|nr:DUF4412 domain-containing protein [Bacteroidia bacterium]MDW8346076.1 DUF4412 domain-containing protein [Bacteroidia bacterium]